MTAENGKRPPVVFISYSHDSPEHMDHVLALSDRLREDGIDCILDRYEKSPPEGWPRWTAKQIRDADFVLMICTQTYYRRVMGEERPGAGQGVRWEGNLINQHIYDADTKNAKFLPVLFAGGKASHIPESWRGATRYLVDTAEGYDELYRYITDQPSVKKNPLGKLKKLPPVTPRERRQDFTASAPGTWPGISLPHGGPKISAPFVGRGDELKELAEAMAGPKRIAAVIGMAGQGKSCLIGEWYKRGARPPEGVGLFWRKIDEPGYTFDRFLDDLHLYLAGEPIDRLRFRTVRERAVVVENLLAAKPCWIVLDGVERWLRQWASDPDAEAKNATPDDRSGYEPAFDGFLKGAYFRDNGSRMLLTTRAVPSTLDENLPVMIGERHGYERRLPDLKVEEAIRLLDELEVKGGEEAKREAVVAYGCHAYAAHVLGVLIRDLYGGEASHWREVNPLKDDKLAGLFERIIETCKDDLSVLEFVACSLGPVPVEMLAELIVRDETSIRTSLAGLKKWQMVEFEGSSAEQHAFVRRFLIARMGPDDVPARRKQIAAWWARRQTSPNPTRIEDVHPLLRAIEHWTAACDPDAASNILLRKISPESHYILSEWLRLFGYLDDTIRLYTSVIEAYVDLAVDKGGHELRIALARCYNNRGNAFWALGHLDQAIADYSCAIKITQRLVEQEGRRELRNDLASCYNNRGNALRAQGNMDQAIADHSRAIEITGELVEREDRRELRNDLARWYNNRGFALAAQGHLDQAIADYGHAVEITRELVEREDRRELRNDLARWYNNRGLALAAHDYSDRAIGDYDQAIGITQELVEREGRCELRNDLAACYDSRGLALAAQNHLAEAIADYARAIEIREGLVEREGRRELRNDLASCYNNRGNALRDKGCLAEAIADYGRAIEIREGLFEQERRRELRSDLGVSLLNRAVARNQTGEWGLAAVDVEKGTALLRSLVLEGQWHFLTSLLQALGSWCRYARELGDPAKTVEAMNEAMQWFIEEVERNRTTEPLLKAAAGFAESVRGNQELLLKHGLDEALWQRFQAGLGGS